MSYNSIISKKVLGCVTSEGKKLVISAATRTDHWIRPDFAADQLKEQLEKAVIDNPDVIPPWADEICARESNHQSKADERSHITAVATNNATSQAKSIHLPTKP